MWSDFIKDVVSFLVDEKSEDPDQVVEAAVGLIVYGATTQEKLQGVAGQPPDDEKFMRKLAAKGVPDAICDLLFAEYVAVAIGAAPSLGDFARLKQERDAAKARAETAEDIAGLAPQSLWNSKWRLDQPAYDLPDGAVHGKRSKSSLSTSGWPAPDEVARWTDFHTAHMTTWTAGNQKGGEPHPPDLTYMCVSESTYGILSTYQRTWFVHLSFRVEKDRSGPFWSFRSRCSLHRRNNAGAGDRVRDVPRVAAPCPSQDARERSGVRDKDQNCERRSDRHGQEEAGRVS
jgi:hypothetical protein